MTDKVDMEVESTVAGTLVEIVVESGMVDVGEPIAWLEGEDDGGGFGDLLAAPVAEPEQADARRARPAPTGGRAASEATTAGGRAASEASDQSRPPRATRPATGRRPRARRPSRPRPGPRARHRPRHGLADRARRPGARPRRRAPRRSGRLRPRRRAPHPTAPAAEAPAEDDKALKRRTAVRRAVARVMVPTATIPQFTVWREVHLDTANAAARRPVVDHRAAAGVRRRRCARCPSCCRGGRTTPRRPRARPASRWRSPPSAASSCRPSWSPTWATRGRRTPRCARSCARPSRARWTAPTWRSPTDRCPTWAAPGIDRFQALLTPPQASVLSLGSIRPRPVAVPGGVGLALTVEAGLTVDHRVADGAHGADLLARFVEHLDGPAG